MKLKEVIQMMKMYASCPVCGEENVGEENGEDCFVEEVVKC